MVYTLQVRFKDNVKDILGDSAKKKTDETGIHTESVRTADFFVLDMQLPERDFENVKKELFIDPLIQTFDEIEDYDWMIEIGFLPGVSDNVGRTALEAIKDITKNEMKESAVYTFKRYFIKGKMTRRDAERMARELSNELAQHFRIA